MSTRTSPALLALLVASGLAAGACAAPDMGDVFQVVDVTPEDNASATHEHFVAAMDAAESDIQLMLPTIEDTALSDAAIAAFERGVDVEVVTDFDAQDSAGALALFDAGVPMTFADEGVTYFEFTVTDMVEWSSDKTMMTHAMVLTDGAEFVGATTAGQEADGWRVVIHGRGEDLVNDLWDEHNQIFGGTDATSLTAYSSLAKSITDHRWRYATDSEIDVEMWLGPQERVVKRVTDAVYSARSDVRVLTNELTDGGLMKALNAKSRDGFDVQVVVGPDFGSWNDGHTAFILEDAGDIDFQQTSNSVVPTIVLIDYDQAQDGVYHRPRAILLTHDLFSASRFYADEFGRTETIVTDQLIDGALWSFDAYDEPTGELLQLEEVWQTHRDSASSL